MRTLTSIFCLFIVAIAVIFLVYIKQLIPFSGDEVYYRQPSFFPKLTLIGVIITGLSLCLRYILGSKLPQDEELGTTKPRLFYLGCFIANFAAYILLTPLIGYLAATLIFILISFFIARYKKMSVIFVLLLLGICLNLIFVNYLDVWFTEPLIMQLWKN